MIRDDDHGSLQISLSQTLALNPLSDQKGLRLYRPAEFWTHNLVATSPSVYRDLTAGLWGACSYNLLAPHLQPHPTCISKSIRFMDWTVTGQLWTCLCVCMPERQSICSNVKLSLFNFRSVDLWWDPTRWANHSAPREQMFLQSRVRLIHYWNKTTNTLVFFSLCTSNTQKHTVRKQATKNAVTGLHVVSSCFKSFVIELVIVCIILWLIAQLHKNL